MPPAKFDPLSNPRTSQVLFLLMEGVDTPTSLAERLKIKPPSVMEQLARLRKIQVVKVGEKTGKEQHYTIDWGKLAEETIRHTLAPLYGGMVGSKQTAEFVKKFPKLQVFLRIYFETIFSLSDEADHWAKIVMESHPTVWDLIDDLHPTLISMMRDDWIFTEQFIDEPALQPISDCLREWVDKSQPQSPAAGTFLLETLSRLGFKSRGEVTPELHVPKETPRELIAIPQENSGPVDTSISLEDMLKVGLITRNEKTGRYRLTAAGRRFLKDYERGEKALPAWLRNKQEAQLVASKLSGITS
jgi:DNA-binding transcriptional ArsR family regulator